MLEPTPTHVEGSHVLRRRDVMLAEEPAEYDLTGDTVTDLNLDLEEDEPMSISHVRQRHSDDSQILDYLRSEGPVRRPISGASVEELPVIKCAL